MSLGTALIEAIKAQATSGALPLCAHAAEGAVAATVKLHDRDRLGNLATSISVTSSSPPAASTQAPAAPSVADAQAAQQRAARFAAATTYLPEKLQLVEVDAGGTAVLRSEPATMRGPRTEYFEAGVEAHKVTLQRFKPRPLGGGRDAVPFAATDETLARLADDAAAALAAHLPAAGVVKA